MVNQLLETSTLSSSAVRLCVSVAAPSSVPFFTSLHHTSLLPLFRTHFQVPYPATPLFATLTKTPGCLGILPILELVFICSARHTCPHSSQRFCVFNRPRDFAGANSYCPFSLLSPSRERAWTRATVLFT